MSVPNYNQTKTRKRVLEFI